MTLNKAYEDYSDVNGPEQNAVKESSLLDKMDLELKSEIGHLESAAMLLESRLTQVLVRQEKMKDSCKQVTTSDVNSDVRQYFENYINRVVAVRDRMRDLIDNLDL